MQIKQNELWDKSEHNLRGIQQELLKATIPMLENKHGEYFVFDLYDFHTDLVVYENTMFSPYKYEFYNTNIYNENKEQFQLRFTPIESPLGLWYGYVKSFLDKIYEMYESDKVILVRFKACSHYISKNKTIEEIPDRFINPWMANWKYNEKIFQLEELIIKEFNPRVIDVSKYYIGDEELFPEDLQGAHFEKNYYMESFKILKKILFENEFDENQKKYRYRISYEAIANMLTRPINDNSFAKLWDIVEHPMYEFEDVEPLYRLIELPTELLIENREFIANIIRMTNTIEYILEGKYFSKEEKTWLFCKEVKNSFGNLTFEEDYILDCMFGSICQYTDINKLFEANCKTEQFNIDCMFNKFLLLFENENLAWVDYLLYLEKIAPEDPEIKQYLSCYYDVIEE